MKFTRVVFLSSASKSEGGSDIEILSPLATKVASVFYQLEYETDVLN